LVRIGSFDCGSAGCQKSRGEYAVVGGRRGGNHAVNIGGILTGDGDVDAAATAVSDNGKIVVGISAPRPLTLGNLGYDWGTDTHAFRWTQQTGTQDLTALLSSAGVNMTGTTIVAVTGISPDGQFIVAQAITPNNAPSGETSAVLIHYCDDNIGAACMSALGSGLPSPERLAGHLIRPPAARATSRFRWLAEKVLTARRAEVRKSVSILAARLVGARALSNSERTASQTNKRGGGAPKGASCGIMHTRASKNHE
jgi:hypothetical protein